VSAKAVVIGGGIGGLATASALRQAGLEVAVFERRNDLRDLTAGAGMVLWHNAVRALHRLDLWERIAPLGTPLERAEWQTWRGRRLARWKVGEMGRALQAPAVGILRANLLAQLAAPLPESVLHLGMECTSFSQDSSGVTATFAGDREERGDVLIGADGINSVVRAQRRGRVKPRYAGYALWFGVVEPNRVSAPTATFREVAGPGARFFLFPVGEGRFYWSAVQNAAEGGSDPETGPKAQLLEAYRGWPAPVEALLDATDEATIYRRDIVDRDPVDSWGEGRMTLLGDAAHPITPNLGQGAAQAIEDAVVLATCLGSASDVPTALRDYEARRMERTASFTTRARRIGEMGRWKNPAACWVRHQIMRLVFPTVAWRQHQQDMAYEF
jgi:2-polyprenyl-6-methoxyphenol hydroxylase-like FAD-dependent oxidoreductase